MMPYEPVAREVTPATPYTEPISVEEAGFNVKAENDGNSPPLYFEATTLARLIRTARQKCEEVTERSFVLKTLEIAAPYLINDCQYLQLPNGPVREIVSVKYIDDLGVEQTLNPSLYRFSLYDPITRLVPVYGADWPTHRYDLDSVRVRYRAGYPSLDSPPETVPDPVLQAMHLLIGHYYEHRHAADSRALQEIPLGIMSLLESYRRSLGV